MTPEEVLKDPEFHALPQGEQLKVLSTIDPDFAALPGGEQIKVISQLRQPIEKASEVATQGPSPIPMGDWLQQFQPENIISGETLKNQAMPIGGMITMPFRSSPIMGPIAGMGASGGALIAGQGGEPTGPTNIPDITAASLNQFNAPLTPFAVGMGGELGGQAAFSLAKKALSPFARGFAERLATNPAAKEAQQMVEAGIPLSPESYQPTKTSRAFQWIADNFLPGSMIVNKRRQEVSDAILKMRQDFIESSMELPKFTESIPQAQAKARGLFAQFAEEAGGKETLIPMPNTIKFIEDNMGKDITMSDQWWTKKFIPWMKKEGDVRSIDQINNLHATYNRSWNKLTPAQKDLRNGIRESLYKDLAENDIQTGLQLEEALKTAQTAAKEPRDIARARWIEQALLDPATKIENQGYVFYPLQFKNQVNKNLTKIEQMFGQEGLDIINKFADKVALAAPDMGKLGKVSDATEKFRKVSGIGLAGPVALLIAGQPIAAAALAVPYGFQTVVAKSLMNPEGWMRRWLTTGIEPSKVLTKEIPKLSILEATND